MVERDSLVKKFQTLEQKREKVMIEISRDYETCGNKRGGSPLYFPMTREKSRKGETVSRYPWPIPRPFLNLSRIRKSNNINLFCGIPRTLGAFRFLLGLPLFLPSGFRTRTRGPNSIDCSSASLFVSSDGVYARQRYPLREL